MNILIRILLFAFSLLLGVSSIFMIILPFEQFSFLSVENMSYFFESIKGNYLYSVLGLVIILASVKILLLSVKSVNKEKNLSYIVKMTDYGEIKISSDTIIGLVQYVCDKFTGLKNIKAKIDLVEGQIFINLKGEVSPEVNITEITNELQIKVKQHIESCTGVKVTEIRVIITNITAPIRNIK